MNEPASNIAPSGADVFNSILQKAKLILLKPAEAWAQLKAESETTSEFYKTYLVYMVAIAPVCSVIGGLISPSFHGSFTSSIVSAVVAYAFGLVGPLLMGFIATKVAPMCAGEISFDNGVRLVGYAATATYVAGFLSIVPLLAILSILFSIYAIYTLYLGVPFMSSVPKEQSIKFVAINIVAGIVVWIIVMVAVLPILIGSSLVTSSM